MDDSYFYSFPTGYRFRPTHEDLIFHYLMKKVKGEPLPPHRIFDVDLYRYHPEDLTGNYKLINEDAWYFFTSRDRKYPNGSRPNRSAGDGSWKPTGIPIRIGQFDEYTGWRRSLDYYEGPHKGEKSKRTKWKMIEYTVKIEANALPNNTSVGNGMQLDKWVLCKVYEKVTSKKDEDDNNTQNTQSDQRNSSTSPSVSNHDSSPRIIPNSLDVHGNQLEATTSTTLNHTHVYHKPPQIRRSNPFLGSTFNFYNQSYHNMIDSSPRVVPNSFDVHGNHLQATTSTTLNRSHAYHEPLLGSTCNFSNQSNYNMIDSSPKVVPNSLDVHGNHLQAITSTTLNRSHAYYEPLLGSTCNFSNQSNYNMIDSSPRVPTHVREDDPLLEVHEINTLGSRQEQQDDLSKMTPVATSSHKLPTHARKYEPLLPEVHEDDTFGSKQKQQDYLPETGDIINDWVLSDSSDFDMINLDSSDWLFSDSDFDTIDLDFSDILDEDNHKPNT
ncbi:nac transcription factor 32 [Quercus suber]|uniref:Nac transcription factor 32 n=1 Tax=Quercus suber TaxID=58331 RepID=A0AAW0LD41_QUESU